ncbi:hypothetical protein [Qingshengfaniella alkalisoli]|uniref:Uncharacterized protein n=1 Tax=Qingshengfaniella alkalisoli TaxID=2599296 RepID=A0A5B8IYH6_9RHOB|nr:hypothetical protein [Qingshengfaniella alkalisoli]QDY69708.1 hypothetical protein FPZ52_08790 [Qingshengfaniella alkalisoli]
MYGGLKIILKKSFYRVADPYDPRRGFILDPEDGTNGEENFEYCDGERAEIDLASLQEINSNCDGSPTGPWQVDAYALEGAAVYDAELEKIGYISPDEILGKTHTELIRFRMSEQKTESGDDAATFVGQQYLDFKQSETGEFSIIARDPEKLIELNND